MQGLHMAQLRREAALALAALTLAALAAAVVAATTHADDARPVDLAESRTATIRVAETYVALRSLDHRRRPVDVAVELPTMSLPFHSVLEALLEHAGVEVHRDAARPADVAIVVDCRGTTRGQLYDAAMRGQRVRELRYTDATIQGRLRLAAGTLALERSFGGSVVPASTIIGIVDGGDTRRDPAYAPFRQAFETPGGALDALGGLIRDGWGEAPLRAALGDRDPLVREAASRALE